MMLSEEVKSCLKSAIDFLIESEGFEVVSSALSPSRFIGMICDREPPATAGPNRYAVRANVRENRQEAERYVAALLGHM